MASQNQYQPHAVALDGGLDYISPSVASIPGSLTDSLNFERTDRMGYSRCYGYERYDGLAQSSLAYTNLVCVDFVDTESLPLPRQYVWEGEGPPFAYAVKVVSGSLVLAVTDFNEWRRVRSLTTPTLSSPEGTFSVTGVKDFDSLFPEADAEALTKARNELFKELSAEIKSPAEGTRPIIGLHGFKDQLYAVVDLPAYMFVDGSGEISVGDTISLDGNDVVVRSITIEDGSWGEGDARGIIHSDSHMLPGSYSSGGSYSLRVTGEAPSEMAGMWRTVNFEQADRDTNATGWKYVDTGYVIGFKKGTQHGPPAVYDRGKPASSETDVMETASNAEVGSFTQSMYGSDPVVPEWDRWEIEGGGTIAETLASKDKSKHVVRVLGSSYTGNLYKEGYITLSNFPSIREMAEGEGITIKGVEVEVVCRTNSNNGEPVTSGVRVQLQKDGNLLPESSGPYNTIEWGDSDFYSPERTLVFGGEDYLFGLEPDALLSELTSGWGIRLTPSVNRQYGASRSRNGSVVVYSVVVKVFFTVKVNDYYFNNGADDVTAKIITYNVTSGEWESEDARGEMQVIDISPVGSSTRTGIHDGDEIWSSPNRKGVMLGIVEGPMRVAGLPCLEDLKKHRSRYQFLTANFYANEEYEAMYGVNGAGRGFSYDGYYLRYLYAIPEDDLDKPRHLAFHQSHLALGYAAGSVLLSVAGEPLNFDGVKGAVEIGVGDPVTGLMRMNGTTLGVFCKKSIHGIVGTSSDNFSRQTLSPYEGAIEYTVVDMGRPVYCSYRGISVFDQTAAYGDFAGSRLSAKVSPWLLPRIQGIVSPLDGVAASAGPEVAVACRTKNQYRLYFGDGYRLTMTLVGGTSEDPQFTIQAEGLYEDGVFHGYIVPRAESSFVDSTGAERIHIAHYDVAKPPPDNTYRVYEYERSWTFDGNGIPAYAVVEENFFGSPVDYDSFRKIRLHGMSLGYAPLSINVEPNYKDNSTPTRPKELLGYLSLPRLPAPSLATTYENFTNITNLACSGRSFNFRLMSYDEEAPQHPSSNPVYADVSPPFVMQFMLVQCKEGKGDV